MGEERAHRIYTALFETWVRRSTLRALTPRWIDWKAETITIPAKHNKTRREKVIDLTPRAAASDQGPDRRER
jgi:integrase